MRAKLVFAVAAIAAATAFGPVPTASAYCDPAFVEHTGYCNVCLLVAAHSHRPNPQFCPL
jgi:hypothetical protein